MNHPAHYDPEQARVIATAAAGAKALGGDIAADVAQRLAAIMDSNAPWNLRAMLDTLVLRRAHASLAGWERKRLVEQMAAAWEAFSP